MAEKNSSFRDQAERERDEIAKAAAEFVDGMRRARGTRPGCDTCRAYFHQDQTCRRNAPVMVPVPQSATGPDGKPTGPITGFRAVGLYPATNELQWCAQWLSLVPPKSAPLQPVKPAGSRSEASASRAPEQTVRQ